MEIQWWLVAGLSAFDFLVVSAACYLLRTHPPIGSRALYAVWAGMVGFAFQAILCFDGGVLVLQLATIAGVFGTCWLQHMERFPKRGKTAVR